AVTAGGSGSGAAPLGSSFFSGSGALISSGAGGVGGPSLSAGGGEGGVGVRRGRGLFFSFFFSFFFFFLFFFPPLGRGAGCFSSSGGGDGAAGADDSSALTVLMSTIGAGSGDSAGLPFSGRFSLDESFFSFFASSSAATEIGGSCFVVGSLVSVLARALV